MVKWKEVFKKEEIPLSDEYRFNIMFGDSLKIREWGIAGLPTD